MCRLAKHTSELVGVAFSDNAATASLPSMRLIEKIHSTPRLFPPEPVRYLGSLLVRNAIRRKESAEDRHTEPFLLDKFLARFAQAAGKADKVA